MSNKKWSKNELLSVVESLLIVSEKPLKVSDFLTCIDENLKPKDIKSTLECLGESYEDSSRGVQLREVAGGYQLVTKNQNKPYIQYLKKTRPFKLSKPATEVLSIIAYRQPCTRSEVDRIRRADSSHVFRTLMDRSLISFAGQSEEPGKPMLYKTTSQFLEIYGLKNLESLPSLDEIKNEFTAEDAEDALKFNLEGIEESIRSK